jgi:hypothetical protein
LCFLPIPSLSSRLTVAQSDLPQKVWAEYPKTAEIGRFGGRWWCWIVFLEKMPLGPTICNKLNV